MMCNGGAPEEWAGLSAHTKNRDGRRDPLLSHLARVAELAGEFARAFGGEQTARMAAALHDLGKANAEFQQYLDDIEAGKAVRAGPKHAIWGAALAYCIFYDKVHFQGFWEQISMPIVGHHAGLPAVSEMGLKLYEFCTENVTSLGGMKRLVQRSGLVPANVSRAEVGSNGRLEMRIRMIFSALTDADYLATEEHFDPGRAALRSGWAPFGSLQERFDRSQRVLLARAESDGGLVNRIRCEIYEKCVAAASSRPGLFRLTVPTGGGKTLSGLAFALEHARRHGQRRVITVLPYTSITDQTANVYRNTVGSDAVLEHHSQIQVDPSEEQTPDQLRQRAAAENWDAPVVVTTTVQFFESLMSCRPSKTRKLHNIAKSVVILDEAQALPVELLRPTADVIRTLVEDYGCTAVLCTATQPALDRAAALREFQGAEIEEIIPNYEEHFRALERVRYEYCDHPVTWPELAEEIDSLSQVMVVLNTRRDAMALLDELRGREGVMHLSTLLCGRHRQVILSEVRDRLQRGEPVKLIATQVVEAGVDLDFPAVYRAVGPWDRIIQAAGRCNREGRREDAVVKVINPQDSGVPRGPYRVGTELTHTMLSRHGAKGLSDPRVCGEYFERLYSTADTDSHGIQSLREALDFPEIDNRYRLIPGTVSAVVRYADSEAALKEWLRSPSRESWRAIQPYLVNLHLHEAKRLEDEGFLIRLGNGLFRWLGRYDETRGIEASCMDPADLIK